MVNPRHIRDQHASTIHEKNDTDAPSASDDRYGNRDEQFMDVDRMVNEGLGGGTVSVHNGLIEETTTDTMDDPESVVDE